MFIICRARKAYSAAQSAPQQFRLRPRTRIGNPSFAPMNITTASGRSRRTWVAASRPQSTMSGWEIDVPMRASRTTFTPAPAEANARATLASSGWASESPVTRTVRSARGLAGGWPSCRGSNASGVTGATGCADDPLFAACSKPPGPAEPVVGVRPRDEAVLDVAQAE